jgi:hypothetical protein
MICFPLHPTLILQEYLGIPLNEEDKFIEISTDPIKSEELIVVKNIDNVTEQIALITKVIDKLRSTEELSNKWQKTPAPLIKRNSKVDLADYKINLITAVFFERFQKTHQKDTLSYHRQNLALALEHHLNQNIINKQESESVPLSNSKLHLSDNSKLFNESEKSPKNVRKISAPLHLSPRKSLGINANDEELPSVSPRKSWAFLRSNEEKKEIQEENMDQAIKKLPIEALEYCMMHWLYTTAGNPKFIDYAKDKKFTSLFEGIDDKKQVIDSVKNVRKTPNSGIVLGEIVSKKLQIIDKRLLSADIDRTFDRCTVSDSKSIVFCYKVPTYETQEEISSYNAQHFGDFLESLVKLLGPSDFNRVLKIWNDTYEKKQQINKKPTNTFFSGLLNEFLDNLSDDPHDKIKNQFFLLFDIFKQDVHSCPITAIKQIFNNFYNVKHGKIEYKFILQKNTVNPNDLQNNIQALINIEFELTKNDSGRVYKFSLENTLCYTLNEFTPWSSKISILTNEKNLIILSLKNLGFNIKYLSKNTHIRQISRSLDSLPIAIPSRDLKTSGNSSNNL